MASRKAFLLRINEQLYKDLEVWAQEDFRSVNGQIEFLLRQMVRQRKGANRSTPTDPEPGPEK